MQRKVAVLFGGLLFSSLALCGTVSIAEPVAPTTAQTAPAAHKDGPFENEIRDFEAMDRKDTPPTGGVLFLGSSSIRFWITSAQDFPELTVLNRGFGGSQVADSVRYADRIVIPYRPRMIVFYAGTNDIDAGKSPAQVTKDFSEFVVKVHTSLPDTRIVYISINPSVLRIKEAPDVRETNRLIADYVRANNSKTLKLSFIDTYSKLLGPDGQPRAEILRPDGLHLNTEGYRLWAAILHPQILALAAQDGIHGKKR